MKHEKWDSFKDDNLALLGHECEEYCYETQNASPTSSINCVASIVAEWLSQGERHTFQSVTKNISCLLDKELEGGVWDSLEDDSWALLSIEWEQCCCKTQ